MSKVYNCYVAATCSLKNIETVKSFGTDTIINYTNQDWSTVGNGGYDVIFDCVGGEKDQNVL